jgi:hypothetical protein
VGGKVMPSGLCYKDALLLLPSFLSTYSLWLFLFEIVEQTKLTSDDKNQTSGC